MSETKQPTADKQEAYQAFIEHYNLSPLNNDAIMNCLFEQHQALYIQHKKIEEIAGYIIIDKVEDGEHYRETLLSQWNLKTKTREQSE